MNTEEQGFLNDLEQKLWNLVYKLRSTINTLQYKHNRAKDGNAERSKLKITSVECVLDQILEQDTKSIFKSWFIDFDPIRAKIAAKKRWLAFNDIIETCSPVCYAGEFDSYNENIKQNTLTEAMTLATIASIIDLPLDELTQLSTDQLEQLKAVAELFPDELVESESGEIPAGWGNQTVEGLIELLIRSTSK